MALLENMLKHRMITIGDFIFGYNFFPILNFIRTAKLHQHFLQQIHKTPDYSQFISGWALSRLFNHSHSNNGLRKYCVQECETVFIRLFVWSSELFRCPTYTDVIRLINAENWFSGSSGDKLYLFMFMCMYILLNFVSLFLKTLLFIYN